MKRMKLMAAMLALCVLLGATVALFSPYAPVVEPCGEIEALWDIEDAREESEEPLITALENCGVPLAYSAEENRFYCPLDLEQAQQDWPKIHLTAPGAKGVRLIFADDYTYDWCADAVRDGYGYQVMAYDDTHFAYFEIVFTGMMQLRMYADEAFSEADIPVTVSLSTGTETMTSTARAHYRGGVTMHGPKKAYRVEFTKNADGTGKIMQETPVMGQVENLLLVPMLLDDSLMRDRLSWDMYGVSRPREESYGACRSAYVELFVNDSYEGVYLLLEPFDHVTELSKTGGADTDCVYRTGSVELEKDRPNLQGAYIDARGYELHYEPAGAKQFAAIRDFIELCSMEDDEAFAARSMEIVDLDSMLHYLVHLQAFGMIDNVFNNFFVIASLENGGYRYSFAPWDMDMTWGTPGHPYDMWVYFPPADRMINLDAGGVVRTRLLEIWQSLRAGALTSENVEAFVAQYVHELNDSGAWVRNAERWEMDSYYEDGNQILSFASDRLSMLDRVFEAIAETEGPLEMLMYDDYDNKYGVISGVDGC